MSDTVTRLCRRCGVETDHAVTVLQKSVHYAELRCSTCGAHNGFLSKPDSDPTKYKRPNAHTNLVEKFSRGFCEMCLVRKEDLPKGQTLEAQHVQEFKDGGSAERANIWIVCTGCHRLIHWVRTYRHATEFRQAVQDVAEASAPWE